MNKNIANQIGHALRESNKEQLQKILSSWDGQKPLCAVNDKNVKDYVHRAYNLLGADVNLNWLDVSQVTDMSHLFVGMFSFRGDISKWNVSNVKNMWGMFTRTDFSGDISSWDVSSVTNMSWMFAYSEFNSDISSWNVSSVTDMSGMFKRSAFNKDISSWDVSHVTNMSEMFEGSVFNNDICWWDVHNVTDMSGMFSESRFNRNISMWDVSNVKSMISMFEGSNFAYVEEIAKRWNIQNCNTIHMFTWNGVQERVFNETRKQIQEENQELQRKYMLQQNRVSIHIILNQKDAEQLKEFLSSNWDGDKPIFKPRNNEDLKEIIPVIISLLGNACNLNWIDVSDITNMHGLFKDSKFHGNISAWDVSNVVDMSEMFKNSRFNGDIDNWDVFNVRNMHGMFDHSVFNKPLRNWDVHHVTDMSEMFKYADFNQDISDWDVSNVIDINHMFYYSKFNHDIKNWNFAKLEKCHSAFDNSDYRGGNPIPYRLWPVEELPWIKNAPPKEPTPMGIYMRELVDRGYIPKDWDYD